MIVITTKRGAIRVADRATTNWYGSSELVGSSVLGLVAATERLAVLRFMEQLAESPAVPRQIGLQLLQPHGKVTSFNALGALVGDSLAIQFTSLRHTGEQPDESLIWISSGVPEIEIEARLQPLVMAMMAGAIGPNLPGEVVHDDAIAAVLLPPGTSLDAFEAAHRTITDRTCFVAQLGHRVVAVRSDVSGVHFGDSGLSSRAAPLDNGPSARSVRARA